MDTTFYKGTHLSSSTILINSCSTIIETSLDRVSMVITKPSLFSCQSDPATPPVKKGKKAECKSLHRAKTKAANIDQSTAATVN